MPRLHFNLPLLLAAWACATAWIAGAAEESFGQSTNAIAVGAETTLEFAEPPTAASTQNAMPLLSYRRSDDSYDVAGDVGVNPLRSPAPPAAALPTAQIAVEEMTAGEPRYAAPAAALDAKLQAEAAAGLSGASAELTPAPIAPVDDYDAASLVEYKAPIQPAAPASTTPMTPAANQPITVAPPSASIPISPPLRAADDIADRRLAPPSSPVRTSGSERSSTASLLPGGLGRFKGLASAGAGLAIVVSLFLLFAWTTRRNGPKSTGVLPEGAFAVLGRAPLTSQSFAQLLRVGNKLVLVAMSADGAQPLAEVTDPLEVDRIAGLCVSGKPTGSSAEFQQVLAQLSKEPARGFLGREASPARRRA